MSGNLLVRFDAGRAARTTAVALSATTETFDLFADQEDSRKEAKVSVPYFGLPWSFYLFGC